MNERAKQVAGVLFDLYYAKNRQNTLQNYEDFISSLPEFNPPKNEWQEVKTIPTDDSPVYVWDCDTGEVWAGTACGFYSPKGRKNETISDKWMPRHVPAPPVVDSELVKEIKKLACPLCTDSCQWTVDKVLDIVMRHEKEGA